MRLIGWDGMGWDGMGWDGMGWDGMGWGGIPSWRLLMTPGVFQHQLWYRPYPDAPWGGSCLNGLYIFCPLSTVLNLSNFCDITVHQARLGRVEVPLTQDALPTRRGVMTPPALCRQKGCNPPLSALQKHRIVSW